MCARYAFFKGKVVRDDVGVTPLPDLTPRYNVAPMQTAPVIVPADGRLEMRMMRWGLVPAWAKDESRAANAINARSETVDEKPTFREAYERRRCLVPADGFYEWEGVGLGKQAHFITMADGGTMLMAGLWEERPGLRTFTVITCDSNPAMSRLHDRMPVILNGPEAAAWLAHPARELLTPCPDEWLRMTPVDNRVGRVREDDPGLIEPVEPGQRSLF